MFVKREKQMQDLVTELQHGHAIYPIGRDRTFRRYWVFRSLPGLFVEDEEKFIPDEDDFLQPVPQTASSNPFNSEHLPLDSKKPVQSKEEKSTSSDKENEANTPEKKPVAIEGPHVKAKILAENNGTVETISTETPMDTDEKKSVVTESVQEQISKRNTFPWAYYSTQEQLDKLINSLNPRGFREGPLKQAILENKKRIVESISNIQLDLFNVVKEESSQAAGNSTKIHTVKSQSRRKVMKGKVQDSSAQELLELNLRELILDLEERIYMGSLGVINVSNLIHMFHFFDERARVTKNNNKR